MAGNHRRNDDAGVTLQRGRRRRNEDNISGKKVFIVGHPHAQLAAAEELPVCDTRLETACDVLFANAVAKAPPIRPVPITTIFFTILLLGLAALRRSQGSRTDDDISDLLLGAVHPQHALHNKTAIDRSFKAVMPDGLIGGALIPCLGRFEAREFRDHDAP